MNQIAPAETRKPRELAEVIDPVPMLDTARFEHMQRVATVMARSTLMPETLYKEGTKDNKTPLPYEQILSNCFLVVNQAVRWGLDPFAVAQCVSVVHGKLCYEGKLVSAVLQAKLGINLHHHISGEVEAMRIYLSDKPFPEEVIELLHPGYRRNDMRIFDGSVAEWKTTGNGTPWTPKNFPRMLIYRGTRDWCRIYEPALMLGVYTPDEMEDLEDTSRYQRARDVTPKPSIMERLSQPREDQGTREGFDADNVTRETETLTGEQEQQNTSVDSPQDTDVPGEVELGSLSQSNPADEAAHGEGAELESSTGTAPDPTDEGEPFDQEDWLKTFARVIVASIGPDETVVVDASKGQFVDGLSEDTSSRARTIVQYARQVCRGEIESDDAKEIIAGKAKMESVKELV